MSRTSTLVLFSLSAAVLCGSLAWSAPQRAPLRSFARFMFHQDNDVDPGRWIGQTSIREYRHPESGVAIFMIANHHVGTLSYFRGASTFLKDAEIILAEGTGGQAPGTEMSEDELPEDGKWIRRLLRAQATTLGHVTETEWEKSVVDKRWVLADLGSKELFAAMEKLEQPIAGKPFQELVLRLEKAAEGDSREEKERARIALAESMIRALSDDDRAALRDPTPLDEISELREVAMWKAISETVKSGKYKRITLMFGAMHARNLAPKLRDELGFELYSTTWRDFAEFAVPG